MILWQSFLLDSLILFIYLLITITIRKGFINRMGSIKGDQEKLKRLVF